VRDSIKFTIGINTQTKTTATVQMPPKHTEVPYDLESVRLPRLTGIPLRALAWALESSLRGLVVPALLRKVGMLAFRKRQIDDPPTLHPVAASGAPASTQGRLKAEDWPGAAASPGGGFRFPSVHDFAAAYREGRTTPEEVARKVIAAIDASDSTDPPLRAFIAVQREDILRQAEAATQRIKAGDALSIFDGVPVAVKDEVDMVPYPTTAGTAFLGSAAATEDSTVVARFRSAGALLMGKTNMHEIGIGVTGLNLVHGTPRNPYAPDHYTGGSSSGSAAAVAAGLCPLSIGADGGGSIRIPSAFCGLVGLKPTYGRVSEFGALPLCWSVAHIGPIAATATDATLGYAVMAGPDPRDPISLRQPVPTLKEWNNLNLRGLTLGVFWPWFRHAAPEIVAACESLLERFQQMGARVCAIEIPDLEAARVAHAITICTEMAQALEYAWDDHHREHNLDVRINLALARACTAGDYIKAQRARTRMISHFNRVLKAVDVILTPTTAVTAPRITAGASGGGESDLSVLTEIMRFVTVANLTGLPAISFPAGYGAGNRPIGMQAIGRAYDEPNLLRLALAAEQVVERRPPRLFHPLLAP
jgi:Asp-tRNA(Asn)/Glu-tRNA(Gln) amidotransferase A subunit family amidase